MNWFGPVSMLGECPRWDDAAATLSWVDIDGGTLHTAQFVEGEWRVAVEEVASPLPGAARADEETWVVAIGGDLIRRGPDGILTDPLVVEPASSERPVRLNELVTDPVGRVWVGSMAYDWTSGAGSFFRVDHDGSVHRVILDVTVANGVGWSPDASTMYTTDTDRQQITAWRYDIDRGEPSSPRVFVDRSNDRPGVPDGLAIDVDGNVWSAFPQGHHLVCFAPDGRELHRVEVPVPSPTSCCFAGPNRDRLVVTTGRKRLASAEIERYPESGRTLDLGPMGVRGLPQPRPRLAMNAVGRN